jgi:hypothetical protein
MTATSWKAANWEMTANYHKNLDSVKHQKFTMDKVMTQQELHPPGLIFRRKLM